MNSQNEVDDLISDDDREFFIQYPDRWLRVRLSIGYELEGVEPIYHSFCLTIVVKITENLRIRVPYYSIKSINSKDLDKINNDRSIRRILDDVITISNGNPQMQVLRATRLAQFREDMRKAGS